MICLISTLGRFALDSYLPSFPAIAKAFAITETETQYTFTFYLLGFGLSQFIYGPLSDRVGRKKVLLVSLVIFLIGNILCALSTSIDQLIISRFIAGIGGGATGVLNRAITADNFKGSAFAKAWSYTTTTLVFTLVFAPIIGSYIQAEYGWRGNFILMAACIAVSFVLIYKFLPESNTHLDLEALKIRQIVTNYKSLLQNKAFVLSLLCYIFAFSGLITFFQVSPFLFVHKLGLSTTKIALLSSIVAGSYLIGGLLVKKFSPRYGIQKTMLIGILLLIMGGISMLCDIENISVPIIMLPTIIFVIGARMVIPNATARALLDINHNKGSAAALIGSLQMVGSAVVSFAVSAAPSDSQLPLGVAFTSFGIASIVCFIFLFYWQSLLKGSK